MSRTTDSTFRQEWATAWPSPRFRRKLTGSVLITVVCFSFFPFFFQSIDNRQGVLVNDWLLNVLPAHDVSMILLPIIWAMTLLTLFRCAQSPELLTNFLWTYSVLNLVRILTITLVPLDPPANLIPIFDPLSNAFYGHKYVTKDLFFSGHTSAMFLMFLYLPRRLDRVFALAATILVGFLVLVQHVHYSFDVLAAPLFTWAVYRLMGKLLWSGDAERRGAVQRSNDRSR